VTHVRVVLDTNVLLSALLFTAGRLAWLRYAWQTEIVRPLASRDTVSELIRVLNYPKFRLTRPEIHELIADYLPSCETAEVSDLIVVPSCRDPFDRPFLALALALAAEADALVTGDADLLVLAEQFPIPILTPAVLRDRLPIVES
jgi:putative PIN family toxin of toxin-antitoxin system